MKDEDNPRWRRADAAQRARDVTTAEESKTVQKTGEDAPARDGQHNEGEVQHSQEDEHERRLAGDDDQSEQKPTEVEAGRRDEPNASGSSDDHSRTRMGTKKAASEKRATCPMKMQDDTEKAKREAEAMLEGGNKRCKKEDKKGSKRDPTESVDMPIPGDQGHKRSKLANPAHLESDADLDLDADQDEAVARETTGDMEMLTVMGLAKFGLSKKEVIMVSSVI